MRVAYWTWAWCLVATSVVTAGEVTYTKDVASILWKNCASCHRPGEVGPFSLLDFRSAAKRADFIATVTADGRMPPWKPEAGYGEFLDEHRLSAEERATLTAWARAGAPEGDPKDLPPAPQFTPGWQLGSPDQIVKMPESYAVSAEGRDVFRCFVIPLDAAEDKTVAAVDFRPGNRRVVHHALFYLDNSGAARKLDAKDQGPGYHSFGGVGFRPSGALGGWAPGAMPRRLPDDMGRMLRKGSDLVLQVHYHPDGKPETDQSELGIYYTKQPAKKIVASLPLGRSDLRIPAGDANYRLGSSYTLPRPLTAIGISPHMHWLGREMRVDAYLPGGKVEHLLWIKDWDFNWQGQYLYRHSIDLPKGTRIELSASYDNSSTNPANPNDPPKTVYYGEQTNDEMCYCWVQFVAAERSDYAELLKTGWQQIMLTRWAGFLNPATGNKPVGSTEGSGP